MAARERILSPTGTVTEEERAELVAMLCPWSSHDDGDHWPRTGAAAAAAAEGAGRGREWERD